MPPDLLDGFVNPPNTIRFRTTIFTPIMPQGEGTTGWVDIIFVTPGAGPNYATMFSPAGVHSLLSALQTATKMMPAKPPTPILDIKGQLQGSIKYGPETKEYFGQQYSLPVIQALGVLMVRANLLDQKLIDLSSSLTGVTQEQATNQYYSSVNMKARIDMIRSILEVCGLDNDTIEAVRTSLDKVKTVSDRRNDLVHARWSSRKGKHRATIYRPNAKIKISEITVTEQLVLDLADAYATAHGLLSFAISRVVEHRTPQK